MAYIRTIKATFFTSDDIVSLSPLARLLYIALWTEADREGRMYWRPGNFKLRFLPGDNCDINALCEELLESGLVVTYVVDGKAYAEIPTFTRHQSINAKERKSALPQRVAHTISTSNDASATRADESHACHKERKGESSTAPSQDGGMSTTESVHGRQIAQKTGYSEQGGNDAF